jgi:hypothetical protein
MNTYTTKDRRGGCYFIDGKPYISVTNILETIDKPAIRWWFGKQIYLAMVKEPTLSEQEAMSSPYDTSDTAKSRGTAVHSIVEVWRQNDIKIDTIPELQPYADAFYKWLQDVKPEKIESEKTIVNLKEGYAGTLDLLAKINGEPCIIDVKTSKDGETYREAFLQVSAYLGAMPEIKRGFVLGLGANGKYTFKEVDVDLEAFLACKKLYEYLNKEDLKKIGYGK